MPKTLLVPKPPLRLSEARLPNEGLDGLFTMEGLADMIRHSKGKSDKQWRC